MTGASDVEYGLMAPTIVRPGFYISFLRSLRLSDYYGFKRQIAKFNALAKATQPK